MMKQPEVSLDELISFEDLQRKRPDLVGENPKGAYALIQRRKENGLEASGALIKRRGHWFVHVPKFARWFVGG